MPTFKRGVCQLNRLLVEKNISQSELARLSGVSQRSISNYVNNAQVMSIDAARAISIVLGCKLDDLYKW